MDPEELARILGLATARQDATALPPSTGGRRPLPRDPNTPSVGPDRRNAAQILMGRVNEAVADQPAIRFLANTVGLSSDPAEILAGAGPVGRAGKVVTAIQKAERATGGSIARMPSAFGGGFQVRMPDGSVANQQFRTARQAIDHLTGARGVPVRSDAPRTVFRFTEPGVHHADTPKGTFTLMKGGDNRWRIMRPGSKTPIEGLEVDPQAESFRTFNEAKQAVRDALSG